MFACCIVKGQTDNARDQPWDQPTYREGRLRVIGIGYLTLVGRRPEIQRRLLNRGI